MRPGKRKIIFRTKPRNASLPRKHRECLEIINSKTCEFCKKNDNDAEFILCDECDDAYHWACLDPPLLAPPHEDIEWLCPNCLKMPTEPDQQPTLPEKCSKCHQGFEALPVEASPDIVGKSSVPISCLMCRHWFHNICLSWRENSLNCSQCEAKLRREGPKGHSQFLVYINEQQEKVRKSNFYPLFDREVEDSCRRSQPINLRVFSELTDWELITRFEASLYYALKTKGLIFCDEQLYESEQMIELNKSENEVIKVLPLSLSDEAKYEKFKAKVRKGAVGPYQIKEDRVKGFYVEALTFIERGTIICEYAGEVCRHRDTLNKVNNDSIFTLLVAGSSQKDLNIAPSRFGNMSRFICGVNNWDKEQMRRVNVKGVRFSYKGRLHIVFVAKKPIEKGECLFLNYNDGSYEEYPTENFVK